MAQGVAMGIPEQDIVSIVVNGTGFVFLTLDSFSASAQKYNNSGVLASLAANPNFKVAVKGAIFDADLASIDGVSFAAFQANVRCLQ